MLVSTRSVMLLVSMATLVTGVARAQVSPVNITIANPGVQGFPATLTGSQIDFSTMLYSPDGLIKYTVQAIEIVKHRLPAHIDDTELHYTYVERIVPLKSKWDDVYHWTAPMGVFPPRTITVDQVLSFRGDSGSDRCSRNS